MFRGWRMADGLADVEVSALAEVFSGPGPAAQLLESAGLSRADQPSWVAVDARGFWGEVSRRLRDGALVDGRASVLAMASTLYPANEVFRFPEAAGARSRSGGGPAPVVWGVPWSRNPNFVGRVRELSALRERLSGVGSTPVLPQALHGLGGVGKTQLAVEFVHRFRDTYEVVWWVGAERQGDLTAGLADLAVQLGIAAGEVTEAAAGAVALLAARRKVKHWLVIVRSSGREDQS